MDDKTRLDEIRERNKRRRISWNVVDDIDFLLQQLDDRDRKIAELRQDYQRMYERALKLDNQNAILLEALENICYKSMPGTEYDIAIKALAKVKGAKADVDAQ
jgi:hypothetical protein